jgi:hypothetical protein
MNLRHARPAHQRPLGCHTYEDSAHKHAATSSGSNSYTAGYDVAGNMTCRALAGSQTCGGTPTGQEDCFGATHAA